MFNETPWVAAELAAFPKTRTIANLWRAILKRYGEDRGHSMIAWMQNGASLADAIYATRLL
jgi:hypothetical protein